ncbi:MAG: tRNA epoxyqueuosine(34) reductase QueG [Thermoanaerobaculia bacterium]|nr:tRNA epoxyqueuosine(34) reductase QueG [Thermoanaerobaculia bacterium]
MDRSALTERVKQLARQEGFGPLGVASLAPAATAGAYRAWLARGDHAGMRWMERNVDLRADARGLLPGAMSALVVALRYAPLADDAPAGEGAAAGELWSRVARYARGDDYHDLMRSRLLRVAAALADLSPGCRSRVCVDTAPLLERELAARAGLGAVGKNTMLLHPEAGSWFLLGELLTTVELVADPPMADLCGDCSRCLEACPTGALAAPYRLDANRCLSYWTIEHRGEIPEPMRPYLRDWVFGCDVCQEVCPWNRAVPPATAPEFEVAAERRDLDLAGLLGLQPPEYRDRLRGSPLRRAKLEGLQRNAAQALAHGASGPRR